MSTLSVKQIEAAHDRGYDRAITIRKNGGHLGTRAHQIAAELYPDSTEQENACARGLRAGWLDAIV